MNTVLNLLSAAAVVTAGVFTSAAPAPYAAQSLVQSALVHSAPAIQTHQSAVASIRQVEPNAQWLTISDSNENKTAQPNAGEDYVRPEQRWVF